MFCTYIYGSFFKVMNYAWAKRSQKKLWWRSIVVLMCKMYIEMQNILEMQIFNKNANFHWIDSYYTK